jgi:hypothetical protein
MNLMKKIALALFLAAASAAAQTGCTVGGGVECTPTLNLWLLPPHYQDWGVPWNANATAEDTLAASVVLYSPTASQKVTQPSLTYTEFNAPFVYGTVPILYFGVTAGVFDSALTRTGAGTFSLDAGTIGSSGATLSLAGLIVGGSGGTAGKCLGSNGTVYNTPVACSGAIPSLYYQTVAVSGSAKTQRPILNFDSYFTATDSSSPAETTIAPVTTGTEPYLVTAPAPGVSGNCPVWDASGGIGDSGNPCGSSTQIDYYFRFTSCTITSGSNLSDCTGSASYSSTTPTFANMPDTNYTMQCTALNTASPASGLSFTVNSLLTTGFTYTLIEIMSLGQGGGYTVTGMCHAHHN